jgi:hypothetical protein
MASAERSKRRSDAAPRNHMFKSMGSGHDCVISWNRLGVPLRSEEASGRAGSIWAAGERPVQIVTGRVDCGARFGGAALLPRARKSDQNSATFVPQCRR